MLEYKGLCVPDIRNILCITKTEKEVTICFVGGKHYVIHCDLDRESSVVYRKFLDTIKTYELNMYPKGGGITREALQPLVEAIKELKHIKLEHINKVPFYTWDDMVSEQRAIAKNMQPTPSCGQRLQAPRFADKASDHWIPWDQITLDDVLVHEAYKYVCMRTFNCLRNYEQRVSSPNASILFKNINTKDLMRERNFGKVSWQEVSDIYEAIKKKGGIKV